MNPAIYPHTSVSASIRPAGWIEQGLAVFCLFMAACTPFNFLRYLRGLPIDAGAEDSAQMVVLGLIYAVALLPVLWSLGRVAWMWGRNVPLSALALLALLSPLWAVDPAQSLMRVSVYLGSMVAASYFALRYPPAQFARLIAAALTLTAMVSVLVVVAMPDFGIMTGTHEGRWRGIFRHKNVLGRFMAFGLFINILMALHSQALARRLYALSALLCAFLLVMAQSATAWAVTLILLLLWPFVGWISQASAGRGVRVYLGLLFGVCAAVMAVLSLQFVFDVYVNAAGRDLTLTDRVQIWQGAWAAICDRPWLGYGYGVFWDRDSGLAYSYVRQFLLWDAPHAHNGLLELALNMGLVGVVLFLLSFVTVSWRCARLLRQSAEPPAHLALLVLGFTLCLNLTEVTLIVRTANLLWLCYVYVALRSTLSRYYTQLQSRAL